MFACMAALLAIGVASIHSACAVREGSVHWLHLRQLRQWIPAGLAAYALFALLPYRRLVDFSALGYLAAVVLLNRNRGGQRNEAEAVLLPEGGAEER